MKRASVFVNERGGRGRLRAGLGLGLALLVVLGARPAQAMAPGEVAALIAALQKAYSVYQTANSFFSGEAAATARQLEQVREAITNEIRDVRNGALRSAVNSLIIRYREITENPMHPDNPQRFVSFLDESVDVFVEMRDIILQNNDSRSSYNVAPALNAIVALRALAMKNRGEMDPNLAYAPETIEAWLADGLRTDYFMVGGAMRCVPNFFVVKTRNYKQLWPRFSDFWEDYIEPVPAADPQVGFIWVGRQCNPFHDVCLGPLPSASELLYGEQQLQAITRFERDFLNDLYATADAQFDNDDIVRIIVAGGEGIRTTNPNRFVDEPICSIEGHGWLLGLGSAPGPN